MMPASLSMTCHNGHLVSAREEKCPLCGAQLDTGAVAYYLRWAASFLVFVLLVVLMVLVLSGGGAEL